jgi:single-strand DNA-binding protein
VLNRFRGELQMLDGRGEGGGRSEGGFGGGSSGGGRSEPVNFDRGNDMDDEIPF